MNPLLRAAAAHVFVSSLGDPQLTAADDHHLRRVLRIRATDPITVSDGAGRWAPARLVATGIELAGEAVAEPAPQGRRAVACAVPKGDRPELIVQKLTELGLDAIEFVETERTVVHWNGDRLVRQLERLRRVAREAAMQSRRVRLPDVAVVDWDAVVVRSGVALAEPGGVPLDERVECVVVGPEGGFSARELAAIERHVTLATQVLRVETAAIAAAVLLMERRARADRR